MPDPRIKNYGAQAGRHLGLAGTVLAGRQLTATGVSGRGNVPPWPRADDLDFHGTLAATWIWARHQRLTGDGRFASNRAVAWSFVESQGRKFVPEALDSLASDEGPYDCAMLLMADLAERAIANIDSRRQTLVDRAARVLAAYLAELHDLGGREFRDPGFLAKALIDYARVVEDRGLLAVGRKFVERAFGMKPPPPFSTELAPTGGLFDFSSTTGTRVLAVIAAEGNTPFVGAWLRERVAPIAPPTFVARRREENTWNACAAWALGHAYVVATDPTFMQSYTEIVDELERRDGDRDGALPRDRTIHDSETLATFYYALAVDALVPDGR
jgi:hypothetical protein